MERFNLNERALKTIKEGAIVDMRNLRNLIDCYIKTLESTDIDIEISAILENFEKMLKGFRFSKITVRI